MPTPEQQAERAAAWKAYLVAREQVASARQQWDEALHRLSKAVGSSRAKYPTDDSITLDGVVYLPDGTTREAE